jgi:hypothetical protein
MSEHDAQRFIDENTNDRRKTVTVVRMMRNVGGQEPLTMDLCPSCVGIYTKSGDFDKSDASQLVRGGTCEHCGAQA